MKYSAEEIAFLEKNYARKGPKWCAEKLGRGKNGVYAKARNLGLTLGVLEGYLTAGEVARACGVCVSSLYMLIMGQSCEVTYSEIPASKVEIGASKAQESEAKLMTPPRACMLSRIRAS